MERVTKGWLIASAAAALILSGTVPVRAADKAGGDVVECAGVNACKGHGACKSTDNACKSGEPVTIAPFDLIAKRVVAKGFFLNHPDVELKIPGALRETAPLVASGAIRAPIAATYPLTAFREAVAHVQRGGKVLFDVDGAI